MHLFETTDLSALEPIEVKLMADNTGLFLSWCARSKAIEKQIRKVEQAVMSFWDELEATSTKNALLIEAKYCFVDDCINIGGQLLEAADMAQNYKYTRDGVGKAFGLPPED